jgi:hypothetical protein
MLNILTAEIKTLDITSQESSAGVNKEMQQNQALDEGMCQHHVVQVQAGAFFLVNDMEAGISSSENSTASPSVVLLSPSAAAATGASAAAGAAGAGAFAISAVVEVDSFAQYWLDRTECCSTASSIAAAADNNNALDDDSSRYLAASGSSAVLGGRKSYGSLIIVKQVAKSSTNSTLVAGGAKTSDSCLFTTIVHHVAVFFNSNNEAQLSLLSSRNIGCPTGIKHLAVESSSVQQMKICQNAMECPTVLRFSVVSTEDEVVLLETQCPANIENLCPSQQTGGNIHCVCRHSATYGHPSAHLAVSSTTNGGTSYAGSAPSVGAHILSSTSNGHSSSFLAGSMSPAANAPAALGESKAFSCSSLGFANFITTTDWDDTRYSNSLKPYDLVFPSTLKKTPEGEQLVPVHVSGVTAVSAAGVVRPQPVVNQFVAFCMSGPRAGKNVVSDFLCLIPSRRSNIEVSDTENADTASDSQIVSLPMPKGGCAALCFASYTPRFLPHQSYDNLKLNDSNSSNSSSGTGTAAHLQDIPRQRPPQPPKQHVLCLDVLGRVWYLKQHHLSDFPGAMYPVGYTLITKVVPYLEREDEHDTVVAPGGGVVLQQDSYSYVSASASSSSSSSSSSTGRGLLLCSDVGARCALGALATTESVTLGSSNGMRNSAEGVTHQKVPSVPLSKMVLKVPVPRDTVTNSRGVPAVSTMLSLPFTFAHDYVVSEKNKSQLLTSSVAATLAVVPASDLQLPSGSPSGTVPTLIRENDTTTNTTAASTGHEISLSQDLGVADQDDEPCDVDLQENPFSGGVEEFLFVPRRVQNGDFSDKLLRIQQASQSIMETLSDSNRLNSKFDQMVTEACATGVANVESKERSRKRSLEKRVQRAVEQQCSFDVRQRVASCLTRLDVNPSDSVLTNTNTNTNTNTVTSTVFAAASSATATLVQQLLSGTLPQGTSVSDFINSSIHAAAVAAVPPPPPPPPVAAPVKKSNAKSVEPPAKRKYGRPPSKKGATELSAAAGREEVFAYKGVEVSSIPVGLAGVHGGGGESSNSICESSFSADGSLTANEGNTSAGGNIAVDETESTFTAHLPRAALSRFG